MVVMPRVLVVAIMTLGIGICACGQAAVVRSEHPHSMVNDTNTTQGMIDGSLHPELIPDATAYRLFFVAASLEATSQNKLLWRKQLQQKLSIADSDLNSLIGALQVFRVRYDAYIRKYNDTTVLSSIVGQPPDYVALLKERDAVVQETRDKLTHALSSSGQVQLERLLQREKRHMRIPDVSNTSH